MSSLNFSLSLSPSLNPTFSARFDRAIPSTNERKLQTQRCFSSVSTAYEVRYEKHFKVLSFQNSPKFIVQKVLCVQEGY